MPTLVPARKQIVPNKGGTRANPITGKVSLIAPYSYNHLKKVKIEGQGEHPFIHGIQYNHDPKEQAQINATVRDAIARSMEVMGDYWKAAEAQRGGPSEPRNEQTGAHPAAGSFYAKNDNVEEGSITSENIHKILMQPERNWTEIHNNPEVAPGKRLFATHIPEGRYGIVDLSTVSPESVVTAINPKGGKFVDLGIEATPSMLKAAPKAESTYLILTAEKDAEKNLTGKDVALTFFPGAPIPGPSSIFKANIADGTQITAGEAVKRGLTHAKMTFSNANEKLSQGAVVKPKSTSVHESTHRAEFSNRLYLKPKKSLRALSLRS
jgi:hypothetical protein